MLPPARREVRSPTARWGQHALPFRHKEFDYEGGRMYSKSSGRLDVRAQRVGIEDNDRCSLGKVMFHGLSLPLTKSGSGAARTECRKGWA